MSLLHFASIFKSFVLTDSRLIMLGQALSEDDPDEGFGVDTDEIYQESKSAYI